MGKEVKCFDCGLPYDDFVLDTVLSDRFWAGISPTKDGKRAGNEVLCVTCIQGRLKEIGQPAMYCLSENEFKKYKKINYQLPPGTMISKSAAHKIFDKWEQLRRRPLDNSMRPKREVVEAIAAIIAKDFAPQVPTKEE